MNMYKGLQFVVAVWCVISINGVVFGLDEIEGSYVTSGSDGRRTDLNVMFTRKQGENNLLGLKAVCQKNSIGFRMNTTGSFTGIVYPVNSHKYCIFNYVNVSASFTVTVPLRGCNTRTTYREDGMEFYNVFVLEARLGLVGPDAKNIGVRCMYPNHRRTIHSNFTSSFNTSVEPTKLFNASRGPMLFMGILFGDVSSGVMARKVFVGQNLTLVIGMENDDKYLMEVFNCSVESERGNRQQLHDENGCPINREIMREFTYSQNRDLAFVKYEAHKFPTSNSVFYRCSVKLCIKESGCGSKPLICPSAPDTRNNISDTTAEKPFFAVRPNSRSPKLLDLDESLSQEDQPILGGLTPEMIQKIFYADNKSVGLNAGSQIQNMIELGNLRNPTIYKYIQNGTFSLEFSLLVEDEFERHPAEIRHIIKSEEITDHFTGFSRCWPKVKVPILVVLASVAITSICLVFLGLYQYKRKVRSSPPPETETTTIEMQEASLYNTHPICRCTNTGNVASIDYRRDFSYTSSTRRISEINFNRRHQIDEFHRGPIREKPQGHPSLEGVFGHHCTQQNYCPDRDDVENHL